MTATWTSIQAAGLTYGDEFTYHGQTKAGYELTGQRVRIVRNQAKSTAYQLINVETGVKVSQAMSLKSAKWWIA
jgi:hypothetical protein